MQYHAARNAGVQRIVHVIIASPSIDSSLRAMVEYALAETGVPYSIVRPTWVVGGRARRAANIIAWILRRMPLFALPGSGEYPVQLVHVEDLARTCREAACFTEDTLIDAAGPERVPFSELVACVRSALQARSSIVHVPPPLMALAAPAFGLFVRDVLLTPEEIREDSWPACSSRTTLHSDRSRSAAGSTTRDIRRSLVRQRAGPPFRHQHRRRGVKARAILLSAKLRVPTKIPFRRRSPAVCERVSHRSLRPFDPTQTGPADEQVAWS